MDSKNTEGPVENDQNPSGYTATHDSSEAPEASSTEPMAVKTEQLAKNPKSTGRLWLLVAVILAVLVVLSGGYVFGFYIPNQPGNVYKSSLKNSAAGIDKMTEYLQSRQASDFKSVAYSGDLKVKSSHMSLDATIQGRFDKSGNGDLRLNADIMGGKLALDLRSIKAPGNTSPDIYLKATGIKQLLGGQDLGGFGSLDGQWLAVDHTILDTLGSAARQKYGTGSLNSRALPTVGQINDAVSAVNEVNKRYLFTTDPGTAVLTNERFIAKETKDGRSVDHFKVGYDKANLRAYVAALKSALDGSKLNDWSKQVNQGKNLSGVMNFKSLQDSANNAKTGYTFDLWADTGTKLIHAITFTDTKDPAQKVTITQNYTGGSKYPFSLTTVSKNDKGKEFAGTLSVIIDTDTNKYTLNASGSGGEGTSGSLNLLLAPDNTAVKETVPSGAKSINEVMGQFTSDGFFGSGNSGRLNI